MIASSSVPNATNGAAPGWVAAQAALTPSMIGVSSIRVSWLGSCGDCPCLAEMMIAVGQALRVDLVVHGQDLKSENLEAPDSAWFSAACAGTLGSGGHAEDLDARAVGGSRPEDVLLADPLGPGKLDSDSRWGVKPVLTEPGREVDGPGFR